MDAAGVFFPEGSELLASSRLMNRSPCKLPRCSKTRAGRRFSLDFWNFRVRVVLDSLPPRSCPGVRAVNAKKTLLVVSAIFLFSSLSLSQMHSASAPSTASFQSDPGGRMGVQYGANSSTLTSAPSHSLADWRNWSSDSNASGWVAPSFWVTSSSGNFPARPVRLASGRSQEVVPATTRVQEHLAERVQAIPKVGQN